MARSDLSEELSRFVTGAAGRIVSCIRSDDGASRITWLIGTNKRRCVLREDPGDGPVAGTLLNLDREASVYRAFADTNVKIPGLIDHRENAILMDMALGSEDLTGLSEEAVESVINSYIDCLADLHLQSVDNRFAMLAPPTSASGAAKNNVQLWASILDSRVKRPSSMAAWATHWLLERAPESAERLVVCHGKVGPGSFMHDGRDITAMVDWEFAHVGDPMDDLAWLAFRGHHLGGGIGDFIAQVERWQQKTGFEVDYRRISYYRIFVMYIWLVSCLAALDNGARNLNRFTYINLVTLMNVIMPRAMMEYDSIDVPETEVHLAPVSNELTESMDALTDLIGITWQETDTGRAQVELMAQQVAGLSKLRLDILDQNSTAVADLTGDLDHDYEQVLSNWIRQHPADARALGVIYQNGLRRIKPDIALAPVASKPFLNLMDQHGD